MFMAGFGPPVARWPGGPKVSLSVASCARFPLSSIAPLRASCGSSRRIDHPLACPARGKPPKAVGLTRPRSILQLGRREIGVNEVFHGFDHRDVKRVGSTGRCFLRPPVRTSTAKFAELRTKSRAQATPLCRAVGLDFKWDVT